MWVSGIVRLGGLRSMWMYTVCATACSLGESPGFVASGCHVDVSGMCKPPETMLRHVVSAAAENYDVGQ